MILRPNEFRIWRQKWLVGVQTEPPRLFAGVLSELTLPDPQLPSHGDRYHSKSRTEKFETSNEKGWIFSCRHRIQECAGRAALCTRDVQNLGLVMGTGVVCVLSTLCMCLVGVSPGRPLGLTSTLSHTTCSLIFLLYAHLSDAFRTSLITGTVLGRRWDLRSHLTGQRGMYSLKE